MARRNAGILVVMAAVLLVVALAQLQRSFVPKNGRGESAQRLENLPPKAIVGGEVRDVAIATTAEMKRAVSELLNYDDAVCRIYESQSIRLTVYVADWAAGKMSPRLVAGHTPDVCWPAAGWERRSVDEPPQGRVDSSFSGAGLVPGAYREFTQAGNREYVVYWHRVGDDFQDYGQAGTRPWWSFASEVWHLGWGPPRAQRFYRISSNKPLESVWGRSEFAPLRAALPRLGLGARG